MATLPIPSVPDATRKRGRDLTADPAAVEPPSKRGYTAGDVIFRVLVPSKKIGRVIGKQGARIQQVRASTGATIKIADAAVPREDRVIIISSKDDIIGFSNAESALLAIAKLILTENEGSMQVEITGAGNVAANTIRLLIAGSQAGGLIGISGQNIVHIRNSSGATVNVLAQNQLPPCASAQESDRVVQVSGNVPEVLNALEKIGCKLRENPPREVISIKPRHNYGTAFSNSLPYLPQHLPPHVPSHLPPHVPSHLPPHVPSHLPHVPPHVPQHLQPPSVDNMTSEMLIMEKLVGGLIGKNGYNISKIRMESGATIKISGGKGEGEQRSIQFGGSTLQVTLARTMVENYIFSQLQPQNPS